MICKYGIIANEIKQDPLPIKGCMELHMLCFDLDGSIQAKVNMCSCDECLLGMNTSGYQTVFDLTLYA